MVKLILPFIFGVIGIIGFAPYSIKICIYLSYIYLIFLILFSKKSVFIKIFMWGLGHWGFGMSWIIVSIYYYGETSIALSLTIYIILTIILSLVFTSPLIIIKKILPILKIENNFLKISSVSALMLASEFTRYYFLNGVPWLIPGNIYLDTLTQNIYPFFGVSFASLIIYFLCTAILISYKKNRRFLFILVTLAVFTLVPEKKIDNLDGDIKVSVIQPSSDPFLKYEKNYYEDIENNLIYLINSTPPDTQLIVLPEAELPYYLQDIRFTHFINKIDHKEKILMGVWNLDQLSYLTYNSIYSVNTSEIYDKIHLVPFGEYIPFIGLRGLIDFFDLPMSNVSHGLSYQENIKIFDNMEISTPICFDISFPETIRRMNKTSLFIVNISNDTWFGDSIGPAQHLSIARVRAIENNRWLVRSTNDGYSAIIANNGTIVSYLDKKDRNILNGNINLINKRSFYNKIGFSSTYVILFLVIITSLINFIRTKKR